MAQVEVSKQKVLEILQELNRKIQVAKLHIEYPSYFRIAELIMKYMIENPESKATKSFIDWFKESEHRLKENGFFDDDLLGGALFGTPPEKSAMLRNINVWITKDDVPTFMDWLRNEDNELYWFLTSPEYKDSDWYDEDAKS